MCRLCVYLKVKIVQNCFFNYVKYYKILKAWEVTEKAWEGFKFTGTTDKYLSEQKKPKKNIHTHSTSTRFYNQEMENK